MKICANCFKDEEIKTFITSSSSEISTCDCCGINDCVLDLSELYDFFNEFVKLFRMDFTSPQSLVDVFISDWNIFTSYTNAKSILDNLFKEGIIPFCAEDKVRYIDEISECKSVWDKLKKDVTTNLRFFSDLSSFQWDLFIQPNYILKKNTLLYRARILPEGSPKLSIGQMGCPPSAKTPAGRANPLGIPYLYLCDNETTTLYETRSVYLDRVCIGKFRVCRDLKIVNFNISINPFLEFSNSENQIIDSVKKSIIIDSICNDLSKPLRRFDTELEYVPTQLICEFCKLNQADGIIFRSSLHPFGQNIVLFNPEDAKCTKVDLVEINKVEISSSKIL